MQIAKEVFGRDDDRFVQWRAVLEAIGYDYMEITDTYRAAGVPLTRITVTEGGSRDSLWNQIKADMLAADVVRFRNAGGAVAAIAAGDVTDAKAALTKTIVKDAQYTPDAEKSALYRRLFKLKTRLVQQDMKTAFETLTAMRPVRSE